jgi:hypothetical protein
MLRNPALFIKSIVISPRRSFNHASTATKLRAAGGMLVAITTVVLFFQLPVDAGTANLAPVGDYVAAGWTANGTGNGTCTPTKQCDLVNENFSTPDTTNYISTLTTGGTPTDEFTMGTFTFPGGVTNVTSVTANLYDQSFTNSRGGQPDTISVSLFLGGVYQTAVTVTPAYGVWGWQSATFNGNWTQTDINNLRLKVTRNLVGSGSSGNKADELRIATIYAAATYPTNVTFSQSASRWFTNQDSVTPGAPLAVQDTPITAPTQGTPFRLRTLIDIATNALTTGSQAFKLQYAPRSGTCDTAFSGETYSDVSASSGAIRFYNNPTPADGAPTTAATGDPTYLARPNQIENYVESTTFNTTSDVAAGSEGLWDFSLIDYSANPGSSYCFRVIKSDSSLLNSYVAIPELTTGTIDTGSQYQSDHLTKIPTGGTNLASTSPTVNLDFTSLVGSTSELVTPEIELRPVDTAFTGTPNYSGSKIASTFGMPEARYASCSAYDTTSNRMIVFGGRANDAVTHYNDAWALNTPADAKPNWIQLTAQGAVGSPPAVRTCTAAYDSTGNRFIVWNGWDGTTQHNEVWTLSLGATPAWTQLCSASSCGTAPSVRRGARMIYDPVGNQLVTFGGYDGTNLSDTWKLTLGASPAWTSITPTGGPPAARYGEALAYDPINKLMWMFAGTAAFDLNDTWKFTIATNTWTQVFTDGCGAPCPTHRDGSTMVYDSANKQMVVFAGSNDTPVAYFNDFNILSNLATSPTWSSPTPLSAVPEPRYYHDAAYDVVNHRMITFSGFDGNKNTLNRDTSTLYLPTDGSTPYWRGLAAQNIMNGRDQQAMYYDSTNNYAYVFGGFGNGALPGANNSGVHISETFRLSAPITSGARWQNVSSDNQSNGVAPLAREATAFASDTSGKRLLVFGGLHGDFLLNDAWVASMPSDGSNPVWKQLCSPVSCGTAPAARWGGFGVYDAPNDRFIIFGGNDTASVNYNDVWALSLGASPTWTQLSPTGTAPAGRWAGSVVFDATNDRMVISGGQANPDASAVRYNDTWALSLGASPAWTQLSPTGTAPTARRSMAYTAQVSGGVTKLISFGGYDGTNHFNNVSVLDLSTTNGAWSTPYASNCVDAAAPACRRSSGGVYDAAHNRLITINGRDGTQFYNDAYAYNLTATSWTNLNPNNEVKFSVPVSGLADGSYHWQYRTNGASSGVGPYAAYGGNSDTPTAGIDFTYCQPPGPSNRLRLGTYFCGGAQQSKYLP